MKNDYDKITGVTAELIKKAAKELLKEQKMSVSIDEICDKAYISRRTFYNYYKSKESLFTDIKYDVFRQIIKLYPLNERTIIAPYVFMPLLQFIKENSLLLRNLYFSFPYDTDSQESEMIYELFFKSYDEELLRTNKIKQSDIKYNFIFYHSGQVGCIKYWLRHRCEKSIKEMSELLYNCLPTEFQ